MRWADWHLIPQGSFVVLGAHAFGNPGEPHDQRELVRLAASHEWAAALLVEASPPTASELRTIVRTRSPFPHVPASRVHVRNCGVCASAHPSLPFHALTARGASLPVWADEVGSFSLASVNQSIGDIMYFQRGWRRRHPDKASEAKLWSREALQASVVAVEVPCRTLHQALLENNVPPASVAVLIIDVEGMDCDIVASIDWCEPQGPRPWLVFFEHKHCTRKSRARARQALAQPCPAGRGAAWRYSLEESGENTRAVHEDITGKLVIDRDTTPTRRII